MKLLVLCLSSCMLYLAIGCNQKRKLTKAQQTAIHYLYRPALITDTFSRLMWHHAIDFRGYDTEKELLYFIVQKNLDKSAMLQLLTLDSAYIEYAPCDSGICEFGGMRGVIDGYYAFRIPSHNLKVDTNKVLSYVADSAKQFVSFVALMNENDTTLYYNFPKTVDLTPYFGREVYATNIGAYISKKGRDIVIHQLAEKLTQGLQTKEEKAQALLRFVTNQITYSYEDLWYETEIAKRAHEVLLSGDGDCSAKTTLYASLLEQCDIPYCLLYYKNHVNVGVQGKFEVTNGYIQVIHNIKYAVAETTVENFIIGKSSIENVSIISKLQFYQQPRLGATIFNAITNEPFQFANFDIE
ncbi:MAG TPA: transglutaminase-like domain-containing protein [Chitinophagaceae bacterium]|nr:transglutaminase-like domain-containing protein [Chitinophagaceae bacterium]